MNTANEKAEKLIPITDTLHQKLSELKGKERITFDELITRAIAAYERESLSTAIDLPNGEGVKKNEPLPMQKS